MRTINAEVATIILIGFLLTVSGIYLNFQNLSWAHSGFRDSTTLNNNEIMSGLIQVIGMAIMFVGATRGMLKRADAMSNKFVNIMDVFTGLIKKEMEVIDDHTQKRNLKEIEEKGETFKRELRGLRRL